MAWDYIGKGALLIIFLQKLAILIKEELTP
jgi:hypothetical protein